MNISAPRDRTPFLLGRLVAMTSRVGWLDGIAAIALCACFGLHGAAMAAEEPNDPNAAVGPVRLVVPSRLGTNSAADMQNAAPLTPSQRESVLQQQQQMLLQLQMLLQPIPGQPLTREQLAARAAQQTEFERHVQRAVGDDVEIRRFGAELITPALPQPYELQQSQPQRSGPAPLGETSSQIPPDYIVSVGDEVLVTLWGTVDADLRLVVDRSGRINIPRVGPVLVAGVRYSDLNAAIEQRVGQVFRNYRLSASLGKLRSIRVYVTGFTQRPGAYTVSSLSTIVNAVIQAGGPSGSGSFRTLELRRGGKLVSTFDFYDLLLRGDRSGDRLLQADDVVHIGPIGEQVALIGSVNRQAIFELKAGETINDLLLMGGGLSAAADRGRLAVESVAKRNDGRVTEVELPQQAGLRLHGGDVVRAFSALDAMLPQYKQNKRVRVDGEVQRPGEYILPPNSTLGDVIKAAGGLTPAAFIYGSELNRESVRITQQAQYDRALRDLEGEFTRVVVKSRASTADDPTTLSNRGQASGRLIERLRAVKLTGRVVLQLAPMASSLPELAVEDGDRLTIPARPTTVGVFGSVFNTGSYSYNQGASIDDLLRLAGGPTRSADAGSTFVIRANGHVVSSRQHRSGWFSSGTGLSAVDAQPGDTIFVPEDLTKVTFSQEAREWTQILYQFGLGAAALNSLKN
ncbi:MAG: sugar ABC transporter substrate-binding protein [Rubrivivax sp.]|nr:MAG: sugar ABC transporter substrate-binding protein [Rubrivivax sp.]